MIEHAGLVRKVLQLQPNIVLLSPSDKDFLHGSEERQLACLRELIQTALDQAAAEKASLVASAGRLFVLAIELPAGLPASCKALLEVQLKRNESDHGSNFDNVRLLLSSLGCGPLADELQLPSHVHVEAPSTSEEGDQLATAELKAHLHASDFESLQPFLTQAIDVFSREPHRDNLTCQWLRQNRIQLLLRLHSRYHQLLYAQSKAYDSGRKQRTEACSRVEKVRQAAITFKIMLILSLIPRLKTV